MYGKINRKRSDAWTAAFLRPGKAKSAANSPALNSLPLRARRWDRRFLHAVKARRTLLTVLTVIWLIYLLRKPSARPAEIAPSRQHPLCNPYDQPGHFAWNETEPYRGRWRPLIDEAQGGCPIGPDWMADIRTVVEHLGDRPPPIPNSGSDPFVSIREKWKKQDDTFAHLSWMRNRTILVLGDSVDRNSMDHLGHMIESQVYPTSYSDASLIGKPEGWDVRGVPHIVNIPKLDSQVVSVFFYGTDDEDAFRFQNDWHRPGKAEDRIDELFVPFTAQLKHPPSFIQLHSGMWDIALFGRQDAMSNSSTEDSLTPDRANRWLRRMRSIVSHLQRVYPGVPIWMRTIHRVGSNMHLGSEDYVRGVEKRYEARKQNFFTDIRCNQLRELQIAISNELCLPYNDFGRWWEGYQAYQDKVHPNPLPGALVYLHPLLHAVWLEAQGREAWETKPCTNRARWQLRA